MCGICGTIVFDAQQTAPDLHARVRAMLATMEHRGPHGSDSIERGNAAIGRTFTEEEGEYGQQYVAILGNELWQEAYGGDPAVVGRELLIGGRSYQIVGVMPPDFRFLDDDVRLWTSLAFTEEQLQSFHSNNWHMVARLQPGVSLEQAQARVDALNARNMDRQPDCPWLIVHGDADEVVPISETLEWVNTLQPGPTLSIFEDTGHYFHGKLVQLRGVVDSFVAERQPTG